MSGENPVVDVISLGVGSPARLSASAESAIAEADVLFGASHHFDEIAFLQPKGRQQTFPSPLAELSKLLSACDADKIVILASGDALYFGIGSFLIRTLGRERLQFHPNISSVQAAMHHLGLPWQNASVVSLHGRPLSSLRRFLCINTTLAVFTDALANPSAIAEELAAQGFADSQVHVCEMLGSEQERVRTFSAKALAVTEVTFSPLNLCVITTARSTRQTLPVFPGIADHLFSTGAAPGYGMVSKREVRLAILSLLQPEPGEIAWDIGAGCGSVSVEWARWNSTGQIHAIEADPDRVAHIKTNCERFGVTENCHPLAGNAPAICGGLPAPDSIFIGGSDGNLEQLLTFAWNQLRPGGKLVASAVTEQSQSVLKSFYKQFGQPKAGAEWLQLSVEKNLPESKAGRTLSPVYLIKCCRGD